MKKFFVLAAFVLLPAVSLNADILITEVVDGNRISSDGSAGSSPDPFLAFVELTNTGGSDASLDGLHYQNFNNGGDATGFGSSALSGTLAAGATYYIAYEADNGEDSAFFRTYGFLPNEFTGGKFFNGDDALVLLNTEYEGGSGALDTSTVVDTYGVVGTDGTGEGWEYLDTVAQRNVGVTSSNSTFTIGEWTVATINTFDGAGAAAHDAATSVVNSNAIPEPSAFAILGLGLLGLARRRR